MDKEQLAYEKARFLKQMPVLRQHSNDRKAAQAFMQLVGEKSKLLQGGHYGENQN